MAETSLTIARLSELMPIVRDHMEENGIEDDGIETVAINILESGVAEQSAEIGLVLDETMNTGSIEDMIFKALVSSERITSLCIITPECASCAGEMLPRALPLMSNLQRILIGIPMTEGEAEMILSTILRMKPTLAKLTVFLGSCGDGVASPLRKYLRQSTSLWIVTLHWSKFTLGDDDTITDLLTLSEGTLKSFCTGLLESTSLKQIYISQPPTGDGATDVVDTLSRALATSTSLWVVYSDLNHRVDEQLCDSLLQTQAVQNFDLTFHRCECEGRACVELNRNAPWKPLLAHDVPLALWPRILAKSNSWTDFNSHRPTDALFFLTKEKCDVLLQNVHRRCIRKRKRFQFT